MSQSQVSDFFTARKGSFGLQPSKRRKLDVVESSTVSNVEPGFTSPPTASRTRSRKASVEVLPVVKSQKKQTVKVRKTKIRDVNQPDIKTLFGTTESKSDILFEVVTASKDDHNASPPCSPSKKQKGETVKRSRVSKTKDILDALSDVCKTPERGYDFSKSIEKPEINARKKLILKSPTAKDAPSKSVDSAKENLQCSDEPIVKSASIEQQPKEKKSSITENKSDKKASIGVKPVVQTSTKSSTSQKASSKDTVKVKEVDSQALKAKLMQSGKFAEVQAKLAQFEKQKVLAQSPIKKSKARILDEESNKSSSKQPAYERFQDLAESVPPSLTLPSKYKLLEDFFRGVDQVVSMLHKRCEVCTFSKLKTAVQQLVRRNFEEKNLGQLKTVYPLAYQFRQEKGLPSLTSGKQNSCQLTIEPNLESTPNQTPLLDKYGKMVFTASHLTERMATFHRRIINIIKKHHKEFLAKLDPPIQLDDKEIKRWHPKFKLDSIPDIEPSPVPQPPETQKLKTASEVLEHAKGTLNARIQRALMLALGQVPISTAGDKEKETKTSTASVSKEEKPAMSASALSPSTATQSSSLSGVSQSLLDRIRAKEAAKTEAAMLRSPEEEVRIKRMERLPELARILRTIFVTQKKPALPVDEVINKIGESYKSNMGRAESEKHVELLVELLPDWVQIIPIKRGRFMKMDKNKDISVVQDKLQKLFKDAK